MKPPPSGLPAQPPDRCWPEVHGIGWDARSRSWVARVKHQERRLRLGAYPEEIEAVCAIAHAVALLDLDDGKMPQVHTGDLIDPQRQVTVEQNVAYLLEIQQAFEPCPDRSKFVHPTRRRSKTSDYYGVSPHCSGRWRVTMRVAGQYRSLGYYPCRHEAGAAFNFAVQLLHDEGLLPNAIAPEHQPASARADEIRRRVAEKLHGFGLALGNGIDAGIARLAGTPPGLPLQRGGARVEDSVLILVADSSEPLVAPFDEGFPARPAGFARVRIPWGPKLGSWPGRSLPGLVPGKSQESEINEPLKK